tara:strand:- start:405 stop:704 length:300 start_codon:yes stop_codon:yes gene_type:complete
MAITRKIEKRLKRIVRQLSGKVLTDDDGDDSLIPEYAITGHGIAFKYSPTDKKFIRVNRGTKAYILDETENQKGRILIYTYNGDIVEIEKEELEYTGFD